MYHLHNSPWSCIQPYVCRFGLLSSSCVCVCVCARSLLCVVLTWTSVSSKHQIMILYISVYVYRLSDNGRAFSGSNIRLRNANSTLRRWLDYIIGWMWYSIFHIVIRLIKFVHLFNARVHFVCHGRRIYRVTTDCLVIVLSISMICVFWLLG